MTTRDRFRIIAASLTIIAAFALCMAPAVARVNW